jgi:copper chaperone CopZ
MKTQLITTLLLSVLAASASAQDGNSTTVTAGFTKLDTNKDGFISRSEAFKEKGLGGVFKMADQNKDGKLDEDEYLKGHSAHQRAEAKEYAGDGAITAKVKGVLLKTKGVPSTKISVETANGVVTLSGAVDTKEEVATAVKAAKAVGGVKSVKNLLKAG